MKGQKFHYAQDPKVEEKPNQAKLFAVGMNGDEDLGQDITMKGQKFHYAQDPAAKKEETPNQAKLFAVGMNGDEDLG